MFEWTGTKVNTPERCIDLTWARMFTSRRLKSPPEVEFLTELFFLRSSEMERSPQPLSDEGGDSVFTCTRLKLHLEGLRLHPPVILFVLEH